MLRKRYYVAKYTRLVATGKIEPFVCSWQIFPSASFVQIFHSSHEAELALLRRFFEFFWKKKTIQLVEDEHTCQVLSWHFKVLINNATSRSAIAYAKRFQHLWPENLAPMKDRHPWQLTATASNQQVRPDWPNASWLSPDGTHLLSCARAKNFGN